MGLFDDTLDAIVDSAKDPPTTLDELAGDVSDIAQPSVDLVDEFVDDIKDAYDYAKNYIDDFAEDVRRSGRHTTRGNVSRLPVVYGTVGRVQGTIIFSGYNDAVLDRVIALCEGEVSAISNVCIRQGDEWVAYNDARFGGQVTVTAYVGSSGQTYSTDLNSRHSNWSSNHRLRGVSYLHVKIVPDSDADSPIRGAVDFCADINGKRVFDPRDSQTKFSRNPALCIRDYLTDNIYGKGIPTADLNDADFIAAANYCDTLVTPYTGAPAQQTIYSCDGILDTGNRVFDNLKSLLTCCNGRVVFTGGKWRLLIDKPDSSVFTFTRDHIIGGWSFAVTGKRDVYNRVTARIVNTLLDWKPDEVVVDDATARTNQDAGFVLETNLTLPFTSDVYRAIDLCEIAKNLSRLRLVVSFTATCTALRVNVGDVVGITHPTPGWTAKLFRLVRRRILPDGNLKLSFVEYSAGAYTLGAKTAFVPPAAIDLPDPFVVPAPTMLPPQSGTAHLITGSSGDVVSRIYASWTLPADPFRSGIELQYKRSTDSVWLPALAQNDPGVTSGYVAPVTDAVAYDLRVRAINSAGRTSAWSTITNYVVVGKTEPPASVTSFSYLRQADGTRQYEWGYGTEPLDLAGFRIYWKADSGGTPPALNTMTRLKSAELMPRTTRATENNQLPADTYWLACVAVDTTGIESTPVYIQADLDEPRVENAILQANEHPTWSGTKTDCFVQNGVIYANANYTWNSLTTWTAWTAWNVPSVSPISYQTASIDAGAVVTFTPLISAAVIGTKTLEIRTSNDNSSWSAWAAYTAQTVTARYLQVKITVSGSTPTISALSTLLTAPVVEEFFNDLDCSTSSRVTVQSTGVIKLNLAKTYATITYVNPVIQSIPANDEWKATVTGKATTGPIVTFYKLISGTWTLTTPTSSTPVDFYVRGA